MADVNLVRLLERSKRTKEKLDLINRHLEAQALQHAAMKASATVALNPLDALLAELQLLASSAIVNEIKDSALRQALNRFARKFEELDAAMSGGLPLPEEWAAKRRK